MPIDRPHRQRALRDGREHHQFTPLIQATALERAQRPRHRRDHAQAHRIRLPTCDRVGAAMAAPVAIASRGGILMHERLERGIDPRRLEDRDKGLRHDGDNCARRQRRTRMNMSSTCCPSRNCQRRRLRLCRHDHPSAASNGGDRSQTACRYRSPWHRCAHHLPPSASMPAMPLSMPAGCCPATAASAENSTRDRALAPRSRSAPRAPASRHPNARAAPPKA